jgi:hypothetical protein
MVYDIQKTIMYDGYINVIGDVAENLNPLKCYDCDKVFSSIYNLLKHSSICKGVSNVLECHLCHFIFTTPSAKSRHLKLCKSKLNST